MCAVVPVTFRALHFWAIDTIRVRSLVVVAYIIESQQFVIEQDRYMGVVRYQLLARDIVLRFLRCLPGTGDSVAVHLGHVGIFVKATHDTTIG